MEIEENFASRKNKHFTVIKQLSLLFNRFNVLLHHKSTFDVLPLHAALKKLAKQYIVCCFWLLR